MPTKVPKRTISPPLKQSPPSFDASLPLTHSDASFVQRLQSQCVPRFIIERIVGRPIPPRIRCVSAQEAKRIKLMQQGGMVGVQPSTPNKPLPDSTSGDKATFVTPSPEKHPKDQHGNGGAHTSTCSTAAILAAPSLSAEYPYRHSSHEDIGHKISQDHLVRCLVDYVKSIHNDRRSARATSMAISIAKHREKYGGGSVWECVDTCLNRLHQNGADPKGVWRSLQDVVFEIFDGSRSCGERAARPTRQIASTEYQHGTDSNGCYYFIAVRNGKYQANVYYAGRLRRIGTFVFREDAVLARKLVLETLEDPSKPGFCEEGLGALLLGRKEETAKFAIAKKTALRAVRERKKKK